MSYSKRLSVIPILVLFLVEYSTAKARSNQYVTCGSVVKLMNVDYRVRLHSHDVKYGTGSGSVGDGDRTQGRRQLTLDDQGGYREDMPSRGSNQVQRYYSSDTHL
uniref:Stromal cell-derived factor 2 n=1 Tax=Cacopsylla melanoneura TaxID=428564 RepID=A0A8D8X0M4_9HEMI